MQIGLKPVNFLPGLDGAGIIEAMAIAHGEAQPARVFPSVRHRVSEEHLLQTDLLPQPDQAPHPCNRVSKSVRVEQVEAIAEVAQTEAVAAAAAEHFRAWAAAARRE